MTDIKAGTTTDPTRGDVTTGDPQSEIAALPAGEWRAIALPHGYADGTTHRWAVLYRTDDGAIVELADWLTEDVARLIAAAPELLEALRNMIIEFGKNEHPDCGCDSCKIVRQSKAVISKATGAAS